AMDASPSLAMTVLRPGLPLRLLRRLLLQSLPFLRRLLRHLLAFGPRVRQSDRNRLFAAFDLPARAAALQRASLALLHRAFDIGRCLLRIFACHYLSPA